jgi:hypothetical protein
MWRNAKTKSLRNDMLWDGKNGLLRAKGQQERRKLAEIEVFPGNPQGFTGIFEPCGL